MAAGTTSGKGNTKSADEITEFTFTGINSRKKEVVVKTLESVYNELGSKTEALEKALDAASQVRADNQELRTALENQKAQYEAKIAKIKEQIQHGLEEGKDAKVNISEGIKIIDEAKIDVKVLSRDAIRVEKSAPKLDASMPTFSGKSGERLDEWLYIMETAFSRLKVTDGKERLQMATPLIKEGPLKALMAYTKSDAGSSDWNGFQKVLRTQFEPKLLDMKIRTQLRHLRQTDSLQKYLKRFHELTVQLSDLSEREKLVAFTDGLQEKFKYEVLARECNTLAQAVDVVCNLDFCANKGAPEEVNMVKKVNFAKFKGRYGGKYQKPYKKTVNPNNGRINKKGPYSGEYRAQMECHRCKRKGHIAKNCRVNLPGKAKDFKGPKKDFNKDKKPYEQKKSNLLAICSNVLSVCAPGGAESLRCVTGTVNGVRLKMALDSGATCSIIATRVAKQYNLEIRSSDVRVRTATNEIEQVEGVTAPMIVNVQGHSCELEMYVICHEDHDVLLGLDWFMATGAQFCPSEGILRFASEVVYLETEEKIQGVDTAEEVLLSEVFTGADSEDIEGDTDWPVDTDHKIETVEELDEKQAKEWEELKKDILGSFAHSYKDLGGAKTQEFKIRLKSDQVVFKHPYRKSMKERDEIKEEIEKMLEAGVIRPSNSAWSSPVLLIPKKDGTKRMCVDYRELNALTEVEDWPLPVIRDILDRLSGSTYFSAIDLKAGYWQLRMEESSIPITAFSTPDAKYEFLRLPFGLRNAPSFFSKVMYQVLGHLSFVEIYLDDVTIHSPDFSTHVSHIRTVLKELRKAGLKVNSTKCTWVARKIKLLGHIISKKSVSMDPVKIEAVKNREAPRNVKQVQSYLGLCNYYRRFIQDFSKIAAPLFRLLQKDKRFVWDDECQKAFDTLKERLTSYPILRHPDPSRQFLLHTDSSGYAIGAILSQVDKDGREYACGYESRLLKGAEVHYGISEKECLAVCFGVKKFRVYLHGTRFKIYTDHSALKWLMEIKDPTGRLARWSIYLQAFDFEILYKKGSLHTNVDAISRPPPPLDAPAEVKQVLTIALANEDDESAKSLDPFEDEALMHYLRTLRHMNGTSKKQINRIDRLQKHYMLVNENLLYRRDVDANRWLTVPRVEQRNELVLRCHLLGHFQVSTTLKRLQDSYYWKNMEADVKAIIGRCMTCQRHEKVPVVNHPALAIEVTGIHDRISVDLVFGLPVTDEGFVGIITICESLSKRAEAYPIRSKAMEEIARHVWRYICRYGAPKEILSDMVNEWCNKVRIPHVRMATLNAKIGL